MKEIWRYIKNTDKKYQVSNYGRVKSKKRKYVTNDRLLTQRLLGLRLYVDLGKSTNRSVAKLVVDHFKKHEVGKDFAVHLDGNSVNNKSRNLEHGTLGDVFRKAYESKKKKRGVYKFNHGKKNWRVVIKINDKVKTIGYFETKVLAETAYCEAYEKEYGRRPY